MPVDAPAGSADGHAGATTTTEKGTGVIGWFTDFWKGGWDALSPWWWLSVNYVNPPGTLALGLICVARVPRRRGVTRARRRRGLTHGRARKRSRVPSPCGAAVRQAPRRVRLGRYHCCAGDTGASGRRSPASSPAVEGRGQEREWPGSVLATPTAQINSVLKSAPKPLTPAAWRVSYGDVGEAPGCASASVFVAPFKSYGRRSDGSGRVWRLVLHLSRMRWRCRPW